MLKIAAEGLKPCIWSCLQTSSRAPNVSQLLIGLTTKKFFSQSQAALKKYSIKNHSDFDQKVLKSDHPVVVDFHAEWCDPCMKLTPKMAELLENSEDVDLAIIDVETNTELVETFKISSVPTVFAFRNGEIVHKFIGLVEANILKAMIDKLKCKDKETKGPTKSAVRN